MKTRKSQAQIIVTVLLILIVIVAVGFVGIFVNKLIRENLEYNVPAEIFIGSEIPVSWNNQTNSVYWTVQRGVDEANLSAVKFIVDFSGKSKSFVNGVAPKVGERYFYSIPLSSNDVPISIEIAPIIQIGKREKILEVTSESKIVISEDYYTNLVTDIGWRGIEVPLDPLEL